ncbi:MAG TPA: MJ0042-type zinc finger domain-containing protein [Phycisphaerae bacterium]|nr:MJ0042-type zinc finger domain-containing protein [Phycisphaerae bacterium]
MQRHANVFVPLACPCCGAELFVTLDEVHEGGSVRCATCGTRIPLQPEDLPMTHLFHAGHTAARFEFRF